jgi:hypothetical protein
VLRGRRALTFAQEFRIGLLLLFFRRPLVFGRLQCRCALPSISASSAAFAAAREGCRCCCNNANAQRVRCCF